MVETGWKDGNALKFGQYSELELEFSPPTTEVEVFVECRGRWGLQHNGFCIDATTLEQISLPREGGRPDTELIEPLGTDILSNGAFEDLTRNPENLTQTRIVTIISGALFGVATPPGLRTIGQPGGSRARVSPNSQCPNNRL